MSTVSRKNDNADPPRAPHLKPGPSASSTQTLAEITIDSEEREDVPVREEQDEAGVVAGESFQSLHRHRKISEHGSLWIFSLTLPSMFMFMCVCLLIYIFT